MSNPKALRDKFLKIMYALRGKHQITQNDVLAFKAVFEEGLQRLYGDNLDQLLATKTEGSE